MSCVHPNAEPFFRESRNGKMCLLIHGFTGSPTEMKDLGDYLHSKGYGVSAPLLPGHGTSCEDLATTTWSDWYTQVEQEYHRLKKEYRQVIPIGLSMGGLLALHLAAVQKALGVVVLSSPVYMKNRKAYFAPLLKYFNNYHDKGIKAEVWQDDMARGLYYYTSYPLTALNSLLHLIRTVRRELNRINMPTLLMHSKDDHTVLPKSAEYLYQHVASHMKTLIWLENSGHVITLGREKERVFENITRFVNKLPDSSSTPPPHENHII